MALEQRPKALGIDSLWRESLETPDLMIFMLLGRPVQSTYAPGDTVGFPHAFPVTNFPEAHPAFARAGHLKNIALGRCDFENALLVDESSCQMRDLHGLIDCVHRCCICHSALAPLLRDIASLTIEHL